MVGEFEVDPEYAINIHRVKADTVSLITLSYCSLDEIVSPSCWLKMDTFTVLLVISLPLLGQVRSITSPWQQLASHYISNAPL